jgi:hypothetical protein
MIPNQIHVSSSSLFWLQHHQYLQAIGYFLTEVRLVSNGKFRNVFLDFGSNLVGVKLIANYEDLIFISSRRLHDFMVAAIASSIYIIGILVSEDKNIRIFYRKVLYEKYPQHNL